MDSSLRDSLLFSPTMINQTTSAVRTQSTPVFTPLTTTTPTKTPAVMESRKVLDILSLMSPPELPPFETFSQSALSATPTVMRPESASQSDERRTGPDPPLSPPISPLAKSTNTIDPAPRESPQHDPILYPVVAEVSPTPSHQPLFKAADDASPVAAPVVAEAKRSVDQHVASRPAYLFKVTSPPEREEYELALYFKSSAPS
ncbi:hypothetical protein MAPG_10469 [Magnaporthiopsis poae ATCC 64411]|uniref:Uncharacterized protein n=1 Tax=Magnaporthiopsis poae (strain ATCC 64411 / 73-15) TaxID=644358 RepID=A0A0C4ECN8_MAGP6|nr:hypothetical protein MAPG_10469 [Magnaporthiopsis poae ATCC 64411]